MNASPETVAKIFNAPLASVRRQYARNAVQLREMANLAGGGKYRGKTQREWTELALMAEENSR